jgi:hypothetical protein
MATRPGRAPATRRRYSLISVSWTVLKSVAACTLGKDVSGKQVQPLLRSPAGRAQPGSAVPGPIHQSRVVRLEPRPLDIAR